MDQELKAKWTAALRSDEFEQGTGKLGIRKMDGTAKYCCMGVVCEINKDKLIAAGITFEWDAHGILQVDGCNIYPTEEVAEALGLEPGFWKINLNDDDEDDNHYFLDVLNDRGMSFKQIADLIDYVL